MSMGFYDRMARPHWDFIDGALAFSGDDCLMWPFVRNHDGYGTYRRGKKKIKVHRVICRIVNGQPPSDKHQAAHSCGRGCDGCVNPNHLSWKTPKENSEDTVRHGKSPRGERYGLARLTESKVRELRARYAGGEKQTHLAAEFGVSVGAVHGAISRRSWNHVDPLTCA